MIGGLVRVLRVAHHAVVDAWREREREMIAQGVEVRLLSSVTWNEGGTDITLSRGGDDFVAGVRTFGTHPNGFLYDPRPLWRALGQRFDVIDLHEEPFALATAEILFLRALRRNRTPYILYSAQNIRKRYPIPIRWFEWWALQGAAGAYVCNREAGEILADKGLTAPRRLIPLGVDVQTFLPREALPRTDDAGDAVIGYVGRLESHKGVDHLVRAVARHPEWTLEITGEGPQRADLEGLASSLGVADRVAFLGHASGADLAERYRRLDVVAVPSVPTPGWLEQFCRVAVEAMASGVPVVASRTGAIPDVVGDAGILVAPGDVIALEYGIAEALAPERHQTLVAAGVERAARFTWDRVAEQQIELYEAVSGAVPAGVVAAPSGGPAGRGSELPVHVVVVAYGDPTLLEGALTHLGPDFPVTIVDNSSADQTRALADRLGATYIDPGRNLGFGAGVNVALRALEKSGQSAQDVLLLNPDARIAADGVRRMHAHLHSDPRLGVVGATQVDPATGEKVRTWWPFPHPARAWVEAVGLGTLNRSKGFAIGSILMMRSEAIDEVGLFDEQFFLYAEEVDWQRRARDAGWRIEVAEVDASHVGAGTGGDGRRREALFHASGEKYIRKHFGARGWRVYRRAVIAGASVRAVLLPGARGRAATERRDRYRRGPVDAAGEA